jgi:ATP-dependent helicase/nuclease subunit A
VDQALTAVLTHPALTVTEGSGFEGPQRLANLERLLYRLLAVSPLDLMAAADWLARNTRGETQDEESPLFDHGMDALRILTVHRAKGLEFDVVILPDLARQMLNRESRTQAQRLFSAAGEEIVALRLGDCRNIGSAIARTEAGKHQLAEERRLFYVAATRARERLILLSGDGTDKRAVWRADLEQISTNPPGVVHAKVDALPTPAARRRERIDPRPVLAAAAAHIRLVKSLGDSRLDDALQPSTLGSRGEELPGGLPREQALALGEAMHRYLATVDLKDPTVDSSLLEDLDEDCRTDLQELARRFHGSQLRQRLIAATSVLRELPVAYSEAGGRVVRGTIDALLVENGCFTVMDYKTDRVTDHTAAAEAHRDQLLAYGKGVQHVLGLKTPPVLEVHFLRDDHTHPLPRR